jgi:glutaminase
VYEVHGDLHFAGAEQVIRNVTRDSAKFDAMILDVARLDTINDPARHMLAGMSDDLRAAGKRGFLVDPDGAVIPPGRADDAVSFTTVEDALAVAEAWVGGNGGHQGG